MHFPTPTTIPTTTTTHTSSGDPAGNPSGALGDPGVVLRAIDRLAALPIVAMTMHSLLAMVGRPLGPRPLATDRGAVSIEQVLWYAAAAISVAVIAAIIWGQVRDTANTPVNQPSAP